MKTNRWIRYLLAALLMLTTLTACMPEDTQLIVALFDEWAREKGFNPKDEKGDIDVIGVLGAVKTVASMAINGTTGDEEADAAVGILSVVYPIKDNDEATDRGLDTRDPKKIEGAIKARPDDYHYRNALGVALLANGDVAGSDAAFREAGAAWERSNPKGSDSYNVQVNTRDTLGCLDRAIKAADGNGTSFENGNALRNRYCNEAARYKSQTGSDYYLKRARDKLGIPCGQL